MQNQNATTAIKRKSGGKLYALRNQRGRKQVGGQPGRRKHWNGLALPQYPDKAKLVRTKDKPQPSLSELAQALSAPNPNDFATVWLQRLAERDAPRFKAISEGWATAGRRGLIGLTYESAKPCRKCGGTERIALSGRCHHCYCDTRFNSERKQPEHVIAQKAQEQQERRSMETLNQSGTEYAAHAVDPRSNWMARIGAETGGVLQLLHIRHTQGCWRKLSDFADGGNSTLHLPQPFVLFQWACNNGQLPDGYQSITRNTQSTNQ